MCTLTFHSANINSPFNHDYICHLPIRIYRDFLIFVILYTNHAFQVEDMEISATDLTLGFPKLC